MCEFCSIIKGKEEAETIYEDNKVMAVLHLKPSHPGQVLLFTKEHYPIFEQVTDPLVAHTFKIANKISTVLFETLNIQGTNIVVQNGTAAGQVIPHFALNIIPRSEGDGLNFQWEPKKISKDEMDTAQLQLKEFAENIHPSMFQKETVKVKPKTEEAQPLKLDKNKENYLIKQIIRIPRV